MTKFKLINTMLLFAVFSGNAVADEVSSKAIYDSKTKTLSLENILVPFIDEFTGKETDNQGIFDAQLQEKTKLVFELIPWSINFKNMFDGKNTSGYILYDHKTRSVKIPCFEVTTIAKFGDGIEGDVIYYKDVNMKQRHVNYPIFHVDNMTKTDSCESSVIPEPDEPPQKPTLTTTPTTTIDDTVEVEVNGDIGTTVFVNRVDTGKTIGSSGKVKVTLDTSGDDGDKSFSISLKDSAGNESEVLSFSISKSKAGYSDFYVKGQYTVYVDPMYNNIEINNNHKTLTQWANELGFEIEDLANDVVYECYNRNQVYPDCTSWGSDETYGYNYEKWEFHKCSYNSWSWDDCYNRPKEIYIKK
ncbi:hypothetical protein [Candidatus Marithrix sp. Canyon 246]|uniref:hypothetical protein n=1 Tax=Candidatus Marithrix sp. Canyon 246 TaxID=1827136 RepID=UPI00084A1506|nr:hypothetical protein [Candidatus Marithrix sp. Canyon 246]